MVGSDGVRRDLVALIQKPLRDHVLPCDRGARRREGGGSARKGQAVQESREQKIRDRAHRLWEAEGRPEGRGHEHWLEAERQVLAEEAAGASPSAPDEPPADPLRNPELIPPAEDVEYPAITGPEQMPDIAGARTSLNPSEIVDEQTAQALQPEAGRSGAGTRRAGGAEVPLRERPGKSTLEP